MVCSGRNIIWIYSALCCITLLFGAAHSNAEEWSLEYQLKAVVLYNFAKFIQWPSETQSSEAITIGVLGRDPFGPELDRSLRDKLAQGRRLNVSRFRAAAEVRDCHILFVSAGEIRYLERRSFDLLAGRNILTVGEAPDFLQRGGMVRFFLEEGKVRFEINIDAVERARLKLSSQLLNLARIYRERPGR